MMTRQSKMRFDELCDLLAAVFMFHGTSPEVAEILARNCAAAERDGAESHGLFRMPGYVSTLRSGWVDGHAVPIVEEAGPAFLRVDARNGFAQPALAAAAPLAVARTRQAGACVIGLHGSHHFGALWLDVEPFAEQGLVALAVVNSMAVVVPQGGRSAVFGTNPMAFAAPRRTGHPLVFDQAASTMAHGDVKIAAQDGRALPDPNAILDGGALLPFGGHKGASIAMMIEVLSAALTGGLFSFEVDWSHHPGAQIPCTGECVILIDPAKTGSLARFTQRVEDLIAAMRAAGQERLPGERRFANRERSLRDGVPITAKTRTMLQRLAEGLP